MAGFENPLWKQIQKIQLDKDGTLHVPATANGEEGVTLGDPPLRLPPEAPTVKRRGLLARLRSLLR